MVAYTSSTAKRDELVKLCRKAFGHPPLIVFQLGGVVSANTGPEDVYKRQKLSRVESAQRHSGGRCAAISRRVAAWLQAQSAAITCSSLRESCSMRGSFFIIVWLGRGVRGVELPAPRCSGMASNYILQTW